MTTDKIGPDIEFHKKMAVQCFNKTWDFLDKKERTAEEDAQMLHLAHASRYHWSFIGKPNNLSVGDWQIARVYSVLNQSDLALKFAKSSLKLCEENQLGDYMMASAYEGIAHAYSVAKDKENCNKYLEKARVAAEKIADEEDKKIIIDQIN